MLLMALRNVLPCAPKPEPSVSPRNGVHLERAFCWKSVSFFSHGRRHGLEVNSCSSSFGGWAEQQRELSSHLLPLILRVPGMDRCDNAGR